MRCCQASLDKDLQYTVFLLCLMNYDILSPKFCVVYVMVRLSFVLVVILVAAILAASLAACSPGDGGEPPDQETIKYSPQGYEPLFTLGNLHDIEIVISQNEWDGLLLDMQLYAEDDLQGRPLTGNYRKATFIYKGSAGDAMIEEVGFRTKGHVNRPYPQDEYGVLHKAHFKIKFNKVFEQQEGTQEWENRNQRRFAKLRELELRMNTHNAVVSTSWDTSQMREIYGYEMMRRAGVNCPRVGSARLWITIGGQKHYFGIHTIIEQVDKSFLTKRYGSAANDGNLYKCLWADSGPANLGPIDDPNNYQHPIAQDPRIIGVKDWQSHYRPTYDLKTNTDNPDHTVLLDFVSNLNALNGTAFKEYLDANFEVDLFLRNLAMNVLLGKWDDHWSIGNNYYLYFNNDGKIEYFPVDLDMMLGEGFRLFDTFHIGIYDWGNHNRELLQVMAPEIPDEWLDEYASFDYPLVEKMFQISEYRQTYEYYLAEFMKPEHELFTFAEYERIFNLLQPVYAPYLDNDMGEGEDMFISDTARMYFYGRTKSIIEQLGLDPEDYELPSIEEVFMPEPPAEELTGREPVEETSFEATEVTNESYGFSFKHPADWTDGTRTLLYEAIAPSQTSGLYVSAWPFGWEERFYVVLSLMLQEGPVEFLALGDTVLAGDTAASIAEYHATIAGWQMHCYSIGVRRGEQWITVHLWNIDDYGPFQSMLFEEIAHTLRFD